VHAVRDVLQPADAGRWALCEGGAVDGRSGTVTSTLALDNTAREALSALLWNNAESVPVADQGAIVGEVGMAGLRALGRRR
jgi:hypothetical protein